MASFLSIYFFTLWVGRRLDSGFVLHGALIGLVAMSLFLLLIFVGAGSIEQPILYWVAHGLKIAGRHHRWARCRTATSSRAARPCTDPHLT